jgi:hypothetical protein
VVLAMLLVVVDLGLCHRRIRLFSFCWLPLLDQVLQSQRLKNLFRLAVVLVLVLVLPRVVVLRLGVVLVAVGLVWFHHGRRLVR